MATTIHDAQTAGMMAGMTSGSRREVPAEYAYQEHLRDAWLNAYDTMAQALRSYEPAPPDAQKEPKRRRPATVRVKLPEAQAEPPPPPAKTTMSAILERQLAEQY